MNDFFISYNNADVQWANELLGYWKNMDIQQ